MNDTMSNTYLLPILSAIGTVIILPLVVDWIKRSWEYSTSINKAKFEILTELNNLLWNYHGECSRLYGLTYPTIIKGRDDKEIDEDIKAARPEFFKASNALYTGLFSYRSKIHQHYDNWKVVNSELNKLIGWAFHDPANAMDDHFILLMRKEKYEDKQFREQLLQDFAKFREAADSILKLLSVELRQSSSFWYPISQQFKRPNSKIAL